MIHQQISLNPQRARRGQSLVEFSLVALVLYMLLAAILTFGHMLYVAQGIQQSADLAARELSRTAIGADSTFADALQEPEVRSRIFDEAYLVIDLEAFYSSNASGNIFLDIAPYLPLVNQQLLSVMIVDRPDFDGDGKSDAWLLRYPGALLNRSSQAIQHPYADRGESYPAWAGVEFGVGIPVVESRQVSGSETIRWLKVVEPIDGDSDHFSLSTEQGGYVALRINYPFQAAAMSSFRQNDHGPFEPSIGQVHAADDSAVVEINPNGRDGDLIPTPLLGSNSNPTYSGIYGGAYGLGAQGAFGKIVRPYRRVIASQAIYRREVFK